MKKDFILGALVIMVLLFLTGIVLIFISIAMGENAGSALMQSHGGIIDTNQYERTIRLTTLNYQIVGTILSVFGGAGVLLSGYCFQKNVKN